MIGSRHHEAKVARLGGVSLATRALTLHTVEKLPVRDIAIRFFGEDTIGTRRSVDDLLVEARQQAARAT